MILDISYTLIFRHKDGVFEGFFPEIPELEKIIAVTEEELISFASKKVRLYCAKHIKELPQKVRYQDLYRKYVVDQNLKIVKISQAIDEYHNGIRNLIDDVCDEFEHFLEIKDIKLIEEYIKRYYKNDKLDDPKLNLLVFEYYALVKNDVDLAFDAFDYYQHGTFPHNAIPKLELIDWLIDHDAGLDAFVILQYIEKTINEYDYTKVYNNKELLEEVEKRLQTIQKQYPNFNN